LKERGERERKRERKRINGIHNHKKGVRDGKCEIVAKLIKRKQNINSSLSCVQKSLLCIYNIYIYTYIYIIYRIIHGLVLRTSGVMLTNIGNKVEMKSDLCFLSIKDDKL
jgi:hypothetical protein